MRVHYLCSYYGKWLHENVAKRTQPLWDAYMFSRTVKSGSINGFCTFPLTREPRRIDATNVGEARDLFGRFIEIVCKREDYGDAAVVPVPSKDSFETKAFRSRVMVEEALAARGREVLPAVRFTAHAQPASQGGARGYEAIHPIIAVRRGFRPQPVVLVDDIVTTGGTLLAVRDRLEESGFTVLGAIACGKTAMAAETAFERRFFELTNAAGEVNFDD